jgi:hypothetical protein
VDSSLLTFFFGLWLTSRQQRPTIAPSHVRTNNREKRKTLIFSFRNSRTIFFPRHWKDNFIFILRKISISLFFSAETNRQVCVQQRKILTMNHEMCVVLCIIRQGYDVGCSFLITPRAREDYIFQCLGLGSTAGDRKNAKK